MVESGDSVRKAIITRNDVSRALRSVVYVTEK